MKRRLRKGIGLLMLCFGLLGVSMGLVAFADPVSMQMANDNDPFGKPPSRLAIAGQLAIYALVGVAGGSVVFYPFNQQPRAQRP